MAGKRRPMDVNLSVVNGGKHWTKDEIQKRKDEELKLEKPDELKPPAWLTGPAKKLFAAYVSQLLKFPAGMVSELDTGTLARYCDCEAAYGEASRQKSSWLKECSQRLKAADKDNLADLEKDPAYGTAKEQLDYWISQMTKLEKICRGCAAELGMTVSSRCRMVVPKVDPKPEEDPLAQLQRKLLGG